MTLELDHDAQDTVLPERVPPAETLELVPLALSVVGIALASLLICCLVAVFAVLILAVETGREGLSEWMERLRFDVPLKTQVGAATVSVLYIGVAIATAAAAWYVGRRHWRCLVAMDRRPRLQLSDVALAALTLGYAAAKTIVTTRALDRHLTISGPTDYLLIGIIAANLCLLAPVAEELFFRGWLYTALRARLSFFPTFLIVTALFTAIHWDASHKRVFLVLPLAVALGLIRETTGSIRPTILVHAMYNFIIIAITLAET